MEISQNMVGAFERRLTQSFHSLNMMIEKPVYTRSYVFRLKDFWTTYQGSWEVGKRKSPYALPQWAWEYNRVRWGQPGYFDDAGADHHLFARVEDEAGEIIPTEVMWWSSPDSVVYTNTGDKLSGWSNVPLYNSSSFSPERGERGPWRWAPFSGRGVGQSEVLIGGGLPNNHHVSMFAVWVKTQMPEEPEPVPPPTGTIWDDIERAYHNLGKAIEGAKGAAADFA